MLLANARRGRLLRCTETDAGRIRIEERGSIANTWAGQEQHRSSPLWKNGTITFGAEHDDREDVRRFARRVVSWLEDRMAEFGIRRIHILASGRFLGALRKVRPAQLVRRRALERKADLMHLTTGKLAKHPVIRHLLPSRPFDTASCK